MTTTREDYFAHFDGHPNPAPAQHVKRALDLLDLRLTSTGSCPRRLVKKPHLDFECWCTSSLNDHGRRYRDRDDSPVVVWEPYTAGDFDLVPVLAAAQADGLRVTITSASPWYPGRTIALIFEPKKELVR